MENIIKNNEILISFSGGRTSAFMAYYLKTKYPNKKFHVVFCNTGKERLETLDFVDQCDKAFNLGVVWLEGTFDGAKGVRGANSFKVVNYETAARNGEPFEAMIKKYSIPCKAAAICTRELKTRTIKRWLKANDIKNCYQAIGIRHDERHRINAQTADQNRFIYPLADDIKADKGFVKRWWARQAFDLQLKEHEGNCDMCFKKSDRKLFTLINDSPDLMNWWQEMETKHGNGAHVFFRKSRSAKDMKREAKKPFRRFQEETKFSLFDNDMDMEFDCMCKST